MAEWLLVSEISEKTGIPENTVRRYVTMFSVFFHSKKFGRALKYSPEAVEVVMAISSHYNHKLTTDEIRERLREELPVIIDPEDSHHVITTTRTPEILQQMAENMVALVDTVNDLREQNKQLVAKVEGLEEQVKASGEMVVEVVREESEKVWGKVTEMQNKKPWWARLLGG